MSTIKVEIVNSVAPPEITCGCCETLIHTVSPEDTKLSISVVTATLMWSLDLISSLLLTLALHYNARYGHMRPITILLLTLIYLPLSFVFSVRICVGCPSEFAFASQDTMRAYLRVHLWYTIANTLIHSLRYLFLLEISDYNSSLMISLYITTTCSLSLAWVTLLCRYKEIMGSKYLLAATAEAKEIPPNHSK